jgi:hypothetical protein
VCIYAFLPSFTTFPPFPPRNLVYLDEGGDEDDDDDDDDDFLLAEREDVLLANLKALVNVSCGSAVNKSAILSCGAAPILVELLKSDGVGDTILEEAIKLIGNVSYLQLSNQGILVTHACDEAIIAVCSERGHTKEVYIACARTLANLCMNEINQQAIGYSATSCLRRLLIEFNAEEDVCIAVTDTYAALCYQSFLNKNRMLEEDVLPLLCDMLCPGSFTLEVQRAACRAVCTVCLTETNQRTAIKVRRDECQREQSGSGRETGREEGREGRKKKNRGN